MTMHPAAVLLTWLVGIVSLAIPIGGGLLLREWVERSYRIIQVPATSATMPAATTNAYVFDPQIGANLPTALLASGIALCLLAAGGGLLFVRLLLPADKRPNLRRSHKAEVLRRPDGTELNVQIAGQPAGPTLVLTHGLGADGALWQYVREQFGSRWRIVTWDLPGMGRSTRAGSNDYSMARLADDLSAVIGAAAPAASGHPLIVIGHSLGGMLNLELFRQPRALPPPTSFVQVHTTHTNPLRTMKGARLLTALEKPVIKPLLRLAIILSPLLWLMNVLSYLNGAAHVTTWRAGFAGRPSFGELDFAARYYVYNSPAVQARVSLELLKWDATPLLNKIDVPVLVVPADQDTTCLPAASATMKEHLGAARLIELANAKHLGLLQRRDEFAGALAKFIEPPRVAPAANTSGAANLAAISV